MSEYNIKRFVNAQENSYEVALAEIKNGYKMSHWMWYIFPQHKSLGYSYNSKFYGISSIDEAKEYLLHPILGKRLREILTEFIKHNNKPIADILGNIDALKLRSFMTLFDKVSPNDLFAKVLEIFYEGKLDNNTLLLIENTM